MAGVEEETLQVDIDENNAEQESGIDATDQPDDVDSQSAEASVGNEPQEKLIKLPFSRIRGIIKTDPDVRIASQDAVVTLAKAAELFIQRLAKEATVRTLQEKKKTVMRKHLDSVLKTRDCYFFLEGVIESFED